MTFYRDQSKAHLYKKLGLKAVRWVDHLGKGELLTNI